MQSVTLERPPATPGTSSVGGPAALEPLEARGRVSHGFVSVWVYQAWYDEPNRLLEVAFHDRVHILYEGVSPAEWKAFTEAKSAGNYVREVLEKHPFRPK